MLFKVPPSCHCIRFIIQTYFLTYQEVASRVNAKVLMSCVQFELIIWENDRL